MTPRRAALAAGATGLAVIALDQVTKAVVRDEIPRGDSRDLILGFDLVHVRNTGVAFGFLADGGALLLVGTALALLALIVFFVLHSGRPLVWLPTGLLLGGALALVCHVVGDLRRRSVRERIAERKADAAIEALA